VHEPSEGISPFDVGHTVGLFDGSETLGYVKLQPPMRAELGQLLAEFRAIVDERPGRMSVGELFMGDPRLAASYWAPRHLVFDFRLLEQPWSAGAFARAIDEREAAFGDRWPTVVLSNHDNSRHVSRYRRAGDQDAVARAAALILLTLRGTPFLYYGEEIGMPDIRVPRAEALDPPARRGSAWWNRDQARAPMPWTDEPDGAFSRARPWLPMPRDAAARNVARQAADATSVLTFYRRLIAVRRGLPAVLDGAMRRVEAGDADVLAYERSVADQAVLVVVNFASRGVTARIETGRGGAHWRLLLGTHDPLGDVVAEGDVLRLRPLEGLVLIAE
jgi:alpha-glucosidase